MEYLDLTANSRHTYRDISLEQQHSGLTGSNPHCELVKRSLERFYGLNPGETSELLECLGEPEVGGVGKMLVGQGSTHPAPRILLKGWAAEQNLSDNGQRQFIRLILAGEICGLSKAAADVVALTEVVHAPLNLVAIGGNLASRLFDAVWTRTELSLRKQIVRLGGLSATERLAHLLLDIYYRLELIGVAQDGVYEFPLLQEMLADILGISSVHINRVLQKLREDRLIRIVKGRRMLLDLVKLAMFAKYPRSNAAAEKENQLEDVKATSAVSLSF